MEATILKDNREAVLRRLNTDDFDELFIYLNQLSETSKKRFGPHPFDKISIENFYQDKSHIGFIAQEPGTKTIIAYSIIKLGYLQQDKERLESYGCSVFEQSDFTYAPSVADAWQSCGLGNAMFHYILNDLNIIEPKRIILWGGVQATNEKAFNFYTKNGFIKMGKFSDHNGLNYDMIR